jgi:hypothetical protein
MPWPCPEAVKQPVAVAPVELAPAGPLTGPVEAVLQPLLGALGLQFVPLPLIPAGLAVPPGPTVATATVAVTVSDPSGPLADPPVPVPVVPPGFTAGVETGTVAPGICARTPAVVATPLKSSTASRKLRPVSAKRIARRMRRCRAARGARMKRSSPELSNGSKRGLWESLAEVGIARTGDQSHMWDVCGPGVGEPGGALSATRANPSARQQGDIADGAREVEPAE